MRSDELACSACGRIFRSDFTFRRAHRYGRCQPEHELLAMGLHLNRAGVWSRPNPMSVGLQLRLFPVRGRGSWRRRKAHSVLRGYGYHRLTRRLRCIGQTVLFPKSWGLSSVEAAA